MPHERVPETAIGPMTIVAVEQYEPEQRRLITDNLAYHFLPDDVQRVVRLARYRPLRHLLIRASEGHAAGIWGTMLCRKRFIEEKIAADDMQAIVILGAGLDTRGYRMAPDSSVPVFEVDLPATIEQKRQRALKLFGEVPRSVHLAPIDFEREDPGMALARHGYHSEWKTFFIWEAVTQYLNEAAVRATLTFLAQAAPGSKLIFTYVRQDFIDGTNDYNARKLYEQFLVKNRVWQFGLQPEQIDSFLERYGWRAVEQPTPDSWIARYLAPRGRSIPVSGLERAVYAEKL